MLVSIIQSITCSSQRYEGLMDLLLHDCKKLAVWVVWFNIVYIDKIYNNTVWSVCINSYWVSVFTAPASCVFYLGRAWESPLLYTWIMNFLIMSYVMHVVCLIQFQFSASFPGPTQLSVVCLFVHGESLGMRLFNFNINKMWALQREKQVWFLM